MLFVRRYTLKRTIVRGGQEEKGAAAADLEKGAAREHLAEGGQQVNADDRTAEREEQPSIEKSVERSDEDRKTSDKDGDTSSPRDTKGDGRRGVDDIS